MQDPGLRRTRQGGRGPAGYPGQRATPKGRSGRWTATVRFSAPIAVPDASSHYEIRLTPPPRKTRGWSHMILPTDRNIAQGENVSERFTSLRDRGRYRGVVTFEHAGEPGGTRIGRFSFRDPVSLARFSGVDRSCSSASTVSVIPGNPIGLPRGGSPAGADPGA